MAAASHCLPCERSARAWQVALCGTRVRLRADNAPAQFVRFVTVGVISTAVYFGLFLALRFAGEQVANLAGVVLSSMLANELHRRLTFHAGDRVGFRTAQVEGGGLAVAGLIATSTALAAFDGVVGDSRWAEVLLIACVTGAVGLVRFVALRLWVFSGHAHGPPAVQPA
jgi:putative flippase GtrA